MQSLFSQMKIRGVKPTYYKSHRDNYFEVHRTMSEIGLLLFNYWN